MCNGWRVYFNCISVDTYYSVLGYITLYFYKDLITAYADLAFIKICNETIMCASCTNSPWQGTLVTLLHILLNFVAKVEKWRHLCPMDTFLVNEY